MNEVADPHQGPERRDDRSTGVPPPSQERTAAPRIDSGLILYTRSPCGLCDRLRSMLERHLPDPELIATVPINDDARLEGTYGWRVPVLEWDGEVLVEGAPEEREVKRVCRRYLRGRK